MGAQGATFWGVCADLACNPKLPNTYLKEVGFLSGLGGQSDMCTFLSLKLPK